jgi:hypothetical protein
MHKGYPMKRLIPQGIPAGAKANDVGAVLTAGLKPRPFKTSTFAEVPNS